MSLSLSVIPAASKTIAVASKLAIVKSEGAATSLNSSLSFWIAEIIESPAAIIVLFGNASPFGKAKSGFDASAFSPKSDKKVSSKAITS